MNKTAGNITFEQKVKIDIENIFCVETINLDGTYNYFFYGKTYDNTSQEILEKLEHSAKVKSVNHDISISTEDKIDVYFNEQIKGVYTIISIEGKEETFESVLEKFSESSDFIVSIRETENSPRFGNRIIRIDIVN
ncbi:MAG: hypothetical protein PHN31_06845 [Candidatus Gracilibacteria bacterium]|nr:hypothetical protein [Candidatus Gracilibacteria bacterium]